MAHDLYYYVLVTAGSEVSYDLSPDLTSFTIEESQALADVLKIRLSDPYKVLSHALQEGMEVEVDLGTVDDHSLIFRGRIHHVDASFPRDGVPRLVVHAHDNSMKMGLARRRRAFKDKTLQQIVEEVAGDARYGFASLDVQLCGNPTFRGNGLRQHSKSDREFLLDLARDYGAIMYVDAAEDGDNFHFLSQYHVMNVIDPALTLYYGRCDVPERLTSFEASSDVARVQLPRELTGLEYREGTPVQPQQADIRPVADEAAEDVFRDENLAELRRREPQKADQLEALMTAAPDVQQELREERGSVDRVAVPGFTTAEELAEIAKNQYSTSLHGMEATGSTMGNHRLHAQSTVEIADAGRFSGKWFLSRVQHTVDNEGYRTRFESRR